MIAGRDAALAEKEVAVTELRDLAAAGATIIAPATGTKKPVSCSAGIASASAHRQESLFEAEGAGRKSDGLMAALDALNSRFGRDVVSIGAAGIESGGRYVRIASRYALQRAGLNCRW